MRAARFLAAAGALAAASSAALPALAGACPPDAGDCQNLVQSGSTGASIDLVVVGDGYTMAEHDKFFQDAQKAAQGLMDSEMYGSYKAVFNAWLLYTPSAQSGADDPSAGVMVDTAFDSTYDTAGISYLLSVNTAKVNAEVNKRFPEADVVLCVVNAEPYGGSGGPIAVVSTNVDSLEIARHELGHTLAGLADEYTTPYPGYPDGDSEPNVAAKEHLDPVKWQAWLTPGVMIPTSIADKKSDHDPVGAFEGARYKTTGVFRPTADCIMRELNHTFCQVCAEAMVKQFSKLSLLIDAPSPASPGSIAAEGATTFSATIPALDNLMITWSIDGKQAQGSGSSLQVDPKALGLADGPHKVTLDVYDATPLVRSDPDGVMKETFTWDVSVDSKVPPTGAGGSGGAAGAGVGGGTTSAGGSGGAGAMGGATTGGAGGNGDTTDETICTCRAAGRGEGAPTTWLLLGAAPVAAALRRRGSRRRGVDARGAQARGSRGG
jgi:hypothetical protein